MICTKNCPHRCIESKIEFPTNLVLCNNIVFKKNINQNSVISEDYVDALLHSIRFTELAVMWFELESNITQWQWRRSFMPMSRKMHKRPLPGACAFKSRLHVQEILEYCGSSLFVFRKKKFRWWQWEYCVY